ncbi:LCP family protein [Paenibacillus eucommiae]|uniref:LCP family protein required for cell wall assembly n=1 Tax=Paenibacillus eucommiae TaxID=1355755 RepID=A0ABS4IPU3_9BACL|nr:LCP family protein [Paenibacillus eucommiae]MBP1989586.1 LCP family protein required for cell wall assembly [Paenibacillus eucommiae]
MTNRLERSKQRKRLFNKKQIRYLVLFTFIVLFIAGYLMRTEIGLFLFDNIVAPKIERKLDKTYEPLGTKVNTVINNSEPFTVLLLGIDQRNKENGRSDTIIYSVVRPKEKKILMISVPRDSYVKILGASKQNKTHDKATHAYAFGGASASVSTIEDLFDHRVDYYATINFKGVEETVDALGGLRLPITEDLVNDDIDHEKFVIKGGQELYNGKDSLNYVRYREDAGGDINRTHRQVDFIKASISRMIELGNVTKIPSILDSLGETLRTNMTSSEIIDNAKIFLEHDEDFITNYTLEGTGGKRADGIWYFNLDEDYLNQMKNEIDKWLE